MKKILSVFVLGLIFGCQGKPKPQEYTVLVYQEFGEEGFQMVDDAMKNWQSATNHNFDYKIQFTNSYPLKVPESPWTISIRMGSVISLIFDGKTTRIGITYTKNNSSLISIRQDVSKEKLPSIILHELGHALVPYKHHLSTGNCSGVMEPAVCSKIKFPTEDDVNFYCDAWDCETLNEN